MAASLNAVGAGASGQQVQGIVQQYQKSATNSAVDTSTDITPYDSGSIIGHVQPGGSGEKLVSGVIQRAAQIVADATAGQTGNALVCTSGVGVVPTPPTGSTAADGLSQAPQHE